MIIRHVITLLFVFLSTLYTRCCGIQCYQCDSLTNDNCTMDRVDRKYLQKCPDTHNYCRKIIAAFYFKDPTESFTIRECAKHGSNEAECYKGKYSKDSYQYICECKSAEGCNASSHFTITHYTHLTIIITISQIIY